MNTPTTLWQKNKSSHSAVHAFTAGNDRMYDLLLAPYDVQASLAHASMLCKIGLLTETEFAAIENELQHIRERMAKGEWQIEAGSEDCHSQLELDLTRALGETGKKIHAARSRNDQVLTAIKLFLKDQLEHTAQQVQQLFNLLLTLSETHREKIMPGYTHLQVAMPSSFGLWFGAYAESLCDDLELLLAAHRVADKNPLGSAAGYGASFPVDRAMTTEALGFAAMNVNVVYAQMTRGKSEKTAATALAAIAATLSRLAMDCCLYLGPNFGFISFPDELTTGSSIMPHKKNPDVFELIRARCNRMQALPNEFALLLTNLPSGYHRDLQLTKELIFPAFTTISDCLQMTQLMLEHITVKDNLHEDERYKYMFSVENVNALVLQGVPFRDAYRAVGMAIESGMFVPETDLNHTHIGSIGNLRNDLVKKQFEAVFTAIIQRP
jgi:argininosuccinate lyase